MVEIIFYVVIAGVVVSVVVAFIQSYKMANKVDQHFKDTIAELDYQIEEIKKWRRESIDK